VDLDGDFPRTTTRSAAIDQSAPVLYLAFALGWNKRRIPLCFLVLSLFASAANNEAPIGR